MIINSLLDTDFYKYVMSQVVYHYKPEQRKFAEYSMKCRSGENLILIRNQLKKEIDHWLSLKLSKAELLFLASIKINGTEVFKSDFIDFLKNMDLQKHIKYKIIIENGHLNIRVCGDWVYSIFAEVPFLAIVQELYWKSTLSDSSYKLAEEVFEQKLVEKIAFLKSTNVKFSEFGSRRRFSLKLQRLSVNYFKEKAENHLIGTSNLLLAKDLGVNPVGTMAHEILMGFQVLGSSIESSQKELLHQWLVEYPDKLKIALSDIFGTDIFLLDFDQELSALYDGIRQDSGIPREIALKFKSHYENMGIPTKSKTLLFSDDLNFIKANELEKEFGNIFNVRFGIGTFCSNDTGNKAVSLVMKMVRMNNNPVIKISDTPGKVMCEDLDYIKRINEFINAKLK